MAVVIKIKVKIPKWLDRICAWPMMEYRRRKFGYTFRKIRLTEGKWTIVDPQDFYVLNNNDWFSMKGRNTFYAVRIDNNSAKRHTILFMHRQIMNPPAGLLVDHKNLDGLDNRRDNLRLATHSQNTCNNRKRKNTSSQFLGVYLHKARERWAVRLMHQGKRIFLGYFDSEIDAARAYDRAAIKYHGEFARLNFPREDYANEILSTPEV